MDTLPPGKQTHLLPTAKTQTHKPDIKEDDIVAVNHRIPQGYQIDTPVFKVLNVLFTPDALQRELTDLPVSLAIRLFEVSGVDCSGRERIRLPPPSQQGRANQ